MKSPLIDAKERKELFQHFEPSSGIEVTVRIMAIPGMAAGNEHAGSAIQKGLHHKKWVYSTRLAGNVITPEIIGSLEFGAAVLGTKVILVLGHGGCGAVKAAIAGKGVPGQISSLFPHIQPAVDKAGPNLEATTKANAKIQATLLSESSPVISSMVKEGTLKVVAGYYDLATGAVTLID